MQPALEQLKTVFTAMPKRRRWAVVASGVVTLLVLAVTGWYGSRPDLVPLFPSLGQEDSQSVLSALRTKGIPYDVEASAGGKTMVQVPRGQVARLRMEFAEEGIPGASVVEGWSLLDNAPFGESDFKQRVNRVRALQGELARTISELRNIIGARVHLAIPERGTLRIHRDRPSASVALRLRPNAELTTAQVKGIAHLVAQSVPGLDARLVSIVDDRGRLLHKPKPEGADSSVDEEKQKKLEGEMEENLVRLLESVVGHQKVIANVAVEIDHSRVEQTEESFDPDTVAVRSEQKSSDSRGERAQSSAGIPGVQANSPEPAAAATSPSRTSNTERLTDVTNYEISKTIRRVSTPAGTVRKLSVAVLVDGRYTGEGDTRAYVPRPPEEMAQLATLAKSVVGFDLKRGDTVEVVQAPFSETVAADLIGTPDLTVVEILRPYLPFAILFVVAIVALLIFAKPLRGLIQEVTVHVRAAETTASGQLAPPTAEAFIAQLTAAAADGQGVQNVQLPPGMSSDEAIAAAQALGVVNPAEALGLAAPVPAEPAKPSIDAKLNEVLEDVGHDDDWDDNAAMTERSARLETTLQELAVANPESIAEALTFWMNDRHA